MLTLFLCALLALVHGTASKPICGVAGTHKPIKGANFLADPQIVDLKTCKKFCIHRSGSDIACLSFSHNPKSNKCTLYQGDLLDLGFQKNASSDARYYSKDCLDLPDQCQNGKFHNFIDNPGFDISDKYIGPWLNKRGSTKLTQPGKDSPNAVSCEGNCQFYQYRSHMCTGVEYVLEFYYKFNVLKSPPKEIPDLDVGAGDLLLVDNEPRVIKTDTWIRTIRSFKTPSHTNFQPFVDYTADDSYRVTFDNFSIVQAPSINTVGPSLVQNGGFETGKLAPWRFAPEYSGNPTKPKITSPGLTDSGGKYKFEYESAALYDPGLYSKVSGFILTQNITTVPGLFYRIRLSFKNYIKGAPTTYQIGVGNYVWVSEPTFVESDPKEIQEFSRIFTAETKNTPVSIKFYDDSYYYGGKHQSTKIDVIDVHQIKY